MRIDQLKYLIEISKSPSLGVASEKLCISYQALSHSMKSLEQELNVNLLTRTNKGTVLTPKGHEFVQLAKQFLQDIEALSTPPADKLFNMNCSLSFLTTFICLEYFLADLFCDLYKKAPHLHLDWQITHSQQLLDTLLNNTDTFALSFIPSHTLEQTKRYKDNLIFHPFFTSKCQCLCSTSHELAQLKTLSFSQLKNRKFVVRAHEQIDGTLLTSSSTIVEGNSTIYDKLIASGACLTLCLSLPFSPYLIPHIENTTTIPLKKGLTQQFGMLYHKKYQPSPESQTFIQLLIQHLGLNITIF